MYASNGAILEVISHGKYFFSRSMFLVAEHIVQKGLSLRIVVCLRKTSVRAMATTTILLESLGPCTLLYLYKTRKLDLMSRRMIVEGGACPRVLAQTSA